jgi:hypothetical protein
VVMTYSARKQQIQSSITKERYFDWEHHIAPMVIMIKDCCKWWTENMSACAQIFYGETRHSQRTCCLIRNTNKNPFSEKRKPMLSTFLTSFAF